MPACLKSGVAVMRRSQGAYWLFVGALIALVVIRVAATGRFGAYEWLLN